MMETAINPVGLEAIETELRQDLENADAMLGTVTPILRHLLLADDSSLFSDEVISRVRGMIDHLARQLLDEIVAAGGEAEHAEHDEGQVARVAELLVTQPVMLSHLHATAMEWQLTDRLQARLALDPVLSPLMQALIASSEPATAKLGMNLLAAQAQFCQNQRRMQMPLGELPGDLLHLALVSMRTYAGEDAAGDSLAATAEAAIRARFSEGASRLGLLSRLILGMGSGSVAALAVSHAGVALFLSALAIGSGLDRDVAVLATNESQMARLALALRSAGAKPATIEEEFAAIHPDVALPDGFDRLGPDRAAGLLAGAFGRAGV